MDLAKPPANSRERVVIGSEQSDGQIHRLADRRIPRKGAWIDDLKNMVPFKSSRAVTLNERHPKHTMEIPIKFVLSVYLCVS